MNYSVPEAAEAAVAAVSDATRRDAGLLTQIAFECKSECGLFPRHVGRIVGDYNAC